jgi:hypothetical protein
MLFWIPVNKAMFTGDDDYAATHELAPSSGSNRSFLSAYRSPSLPRSAVGIDDGIIHAHPADRVCVAPRARRRVATAANNRSPTAWPKESLTFLKSALPETVDFGLGLKALVQMVGH